VFRAYGDLMSGNCYKVKLVLTQLEFLFEWVHVDILKGECDRPGFLAMNPNGRIPVLEVEPGVYLSESNAIISFLAEGTPLMPEDRLERARVMQWLFFEQYDHEPHIATARFWIRYLNRGEEYGDQLAQKRAAGNAALDLMDRHLRDQPFLVAGRYTVADVALYAYTHVAHEGGFDLAPYPAVRSWLARVASQPRHITMND